MIQLIKVTGDSLSPEYQEGDFVLVVKIPFFLRSIRPGDVIVFRQIAYGDLIKRVERIDPAADLLYVKGSHPDSQDSRQFGPIPRSDLIGKVIWHLRKPLDS
jgi:signal peptidase I